MNKNPDVVEAINNLIDSYVLPEEVVNVLRRYTEDIAVSISNKRTIEQIEEFFRDKTISKKE